MNKRPTVVAQKPVSAPTILPIVWPEITFSGDIGKTIIHPEFSGLNLISGFRGKGKTSWGLKIDRPSIS